MALLSFALGPCHTLTIALGVRKSERLADAMGG